MIKALWRVIRWGAAGLVVSGTLWLFADTVNHMPGAESQSYPFWLWYGNLQGFLKATYVRS